MMSTRILVLLATMIISAFPNAALASHYGLNKVFDKFMFWCAISGLMIGFCTAVVLQLLHRSKLKTAFSLIAIAGCGTYFFILGELWRAPFELPGLFIFLLLVWITAVFSYWVTRLLLTLTFKKK